MELKLGVYIRMTGGKSTQLRWMHLDDQLGSLNYIEKQMNILEKKWMHQIQYWMR
jgi:hypothetical protein